MIKMYEITKEWIKTLETFKVYFYVTELVTSRVPFLDQNHLQHPLRDTELTRFKKNTNWGQSLARKIIHESI